MTIILPAAHLHAGGYSPASYVLNGTDEVLTRTISSSGASTTICTISMWMKTTSDVGAKYFLISYFTSVDFTRFFGQDNETLAVQCTDSSTVLWTEITTGTDLSIDDTWHHYVFRCDSTQGTSDDRIRMYKDGVLLTDGAGTGGEPGSSETNRMFMNGKIMDIGNVSGSVFRAKKLAFIDVLEGVSAAPTDFAFDDGGTWTRMPYAGSYGTYGFSLDGTSGFNDVSGNGQHFTGLNMTIADNLDGADLPPYTS